MQISTLSHAWTKAGKRIRNVGFAVVIVIGFSGIMPAIASADTDYHNLPNGTVTASHPMTLPSDLRSVASGKRITYVSTDVFGNKFLVTGAILTPQNDQGGGKIVAWAHGTTGVDDHCAPSANLDVFWPEAVAATKSYLQHGWTVAATDYQGLGGTGDHQYLVGNTEARSVIDSVRAARNMNRGLSNNWVAAGHSEGGQAALFAGEINNSYGQGLVLKGVVALAPVSNFHTLWPAVPGSPFNGYLAFSVFGLKAYDPSTDISSILAQPALDEYPIVYTGCWGEVLDAYQNFTADQMLVGGQFSASVLDKIAAYGDPAQVPSSVPVFIVQGTADPLMLVTPALQDEECANGVRSSVSYYDGVDHDNIPIVSTTEVASYITARFASQPAPTSCN